LLAVSSDDHGFELKSCQTKYVKLRISASQLNMQYIVVNMFFFNITLSEQFQNPVERGKIDTPNK